MNPPQPPSPGSNALRNALLARHARVVPRLDVLRAQALRSLPHPAPAHGPSPSPSPSRARLFTHLRQTLALVIGPRPLPWAVLAALGLLAAGLDQASRPTATGVSLQPPHHPVSTHLSRLESWRERQRLLAEIAGAAPGDLPESSPALPRPRTPPAPTPPTAPVPSPATGPEARSSQPTPFQAAPARA